MHLWVDGERVLVVREGAWTIPTGTRTGGRIRLSRSGLHLCCWQDNGAGGFDVKGAAGHPDRDQRYTVERLSVIDIT